MSSEGVTPPVENTKPRVKGKTTRIEPSTLFNQPNQTFTLHAGARLYDGCRVLGNNSLIKRQFHLSLWFMEVRRVYLWIDLSRCGLRKEDIGGVLAGLSECVELKLGLNVFVEQYGGLFPKFALNIWYSDVSEKWTCVEGKLRELGLSFKYVERGLFTYFQVYTPKKKLVTVDA